MGWHTEGQDLVFKVVVLEILVDMTLIAVQNEQPVYPSLLVKVALNNLIHDEMIEDKSQSTGTT